MNSRRPVPFHQGKVRDTYTLDDPHHLLVVASDRLSIFDVVLKELIPGKGEILTRLTKFWLTQSPIASLMPNHFVAAEPAAMPGWARTESSRSMIVRRAEMLPIECIVRGYLAGSVWREYCISGTMHGAPLPSGLRYLEPLPAPVFTSSTKAPRGEHDFNLSADQAVGLVGGDILVALKNASLTLYNTAATIARASGVILVDTKFEFGLIDGQLMLCDEVLTPDSSRFLLEETFSRADPIWMDKEYAREWGMSTGWDKRPPPPPVPLEVIYEIQRRYAVIAERLLSRPD